MIQAGLIVRKARFISNRSIRRNPTFYGTGVPYSTTPLLRLTEPFLSSRGIILATRFSTFSSRNITLSKNDLLLQIHTRKCCETKKLPSPGPISSVCKVSFSARDPVIFHIRFSSTANNENATNSVSSDDSIPIQPVSRNQAKLLERTEALLSDHFPAGNLSVSQIVDASTCIFHWINTGEHRYLGAEQAELLIKRLIIERGGGKSLGTEKEIDNENAMVEWDMLHFEKVSLSCGVSCRLDSFVRSHRYTGFRMICPIVTPVCTLHQFPLPRSGFYRQNTVNCFNLRKGIHLFKTGNNFAS